MVRINYEVSDDLHRRMKTLASQQGRTLKGWFERALATEVERQEKERAEQERKRRSR